MSTMVGMVHVGCPHGQACKEAGAGWGGCRVVKCVLWLRVSHQDGSQDSANQRGPLEAEAARLGLDVVKVFDVSGSAWTPGRVQGQVSELVAGVQRGAYSHILLWSLDRLTREGLEATVRAVRRIEEAGATLVSLQEPWLASAGEMKPLLLAFLGWAASFESTRRSERIKAGLAKRKAAGLPVGRQPGSKDKSQRRRSGYYARYGR